MAGPRQVRLNGNNNGVKAPPEAPLASNGIYNNHNNQDSSTRSGEEEEATGRYKKWNKILNGTQLENLRTHKYSSTSNSLLDPIFQPYWNFVVQLLPLTVAPNVLTITGLVLNILTSLLVFYYSADLEPSSVVPRWLCLTYALAIFAYQTLDAIDGKQARRTGTSSPLGELFDHGCDSLSTVFLTLGVAAVTGGGASALTLFHCALGSFLFYCVHWRTYMTGSLYFGKMDVTEAELAIIGVHLATSVLGSEVWGLTVMGVEARTLVILAAVPMEFWSLGQTFGIMLDKWRKGEKTLAGTSVLAPGVAIAAVYVPMIYVAVFSNERVYESCPVLYILSFGFVACKVTDGLIVAHMTKSGVRMWDWSLVGPILMCCNVWSGSVVVSERALLWWMLVGCGVDLCVYCDKVCREICEGLKISLFRIKSM